MAWDLSIGDSAAVATIGGADGPTAIYVSSILAPDLLGAIAVAAGLMPLPCVVRHRSTA